MNVTGRNNEIHGGMGETGQYIQCMTMEIKKKESQLKILCRYFHGFIAEDINFLNNLILAEYDDRENMSSVICEIPV